MSNRWQGIYYFTSFLTNPSFRTINVLLSSDSCNSHIHLLLFLQVNFWIFDTLDLQVYSYVSNLSSCDNHADMQCTGIALSAGRYKRVFFPARKGSARSIFFLPYCLVREYQLSLLLPVEWSNSFRLFYGGHIFLWQYNCLKTYVQRKTVTH